MDRKFAKNWKSVATLNYSNFSLWASKWRVETFESPPPLQKISKRDFFFKFDTAQGSFIENLILPNVYKESFQQSFKVVINWHFLKIKDRIFCELNPISSWCGCVRAFLYPLFANFRQINHIRGGGVQDAWNSVLAVYMDARNGAGILFKNILHHSL